MLYTPGLHVVAGNHGVGSSITCLNILRWLGCGEPVLGLSPSAPRPVAAITIFRSPEADQRFLGASTPVLEIAGRPGDREGAADLIQAVREAVKAAREAAPPEAAEQPAAITIDPAFAVTPSCSINNGREVADALAALAAMSAQLDAAFILSHHLAKQSPRDAPLYSRIAGCAAWSQISPSKTIIEPGSQSMTDRRRTITYIPPSGGTFAWDCELGHDGVLTPANPSTADDYIAAVDPGVEIRTSEIVDFFELDGKSKATAERWIARALEQGRLVKAKHGAYQVSPRFVTP